MFLFFFLSGFSAIWVVYNDTLPSIYTTFILLCIVAYLTCLVYRAYRERERGRSTDGLLSGWQLVVLSLCIFAENPKFKKGMSSKNPRIPKVETSKIESNRIASN